MHFAAQKILLAKRLLIKSSIHEWTSCDSGEKSLQKTGINQDDCWDKSYKKQILDTVEQSGLELTTEYGRGSKPHMISMFTVTRQETVIGPSPRWNLS